ncbi:cell surface protein [methanogenic archaeon ISO4-H5]|nr:cell surface protein [methanogenic archaeon ISO4-H5]
MKPVYEGAEISWEIRDDTLFLSGNGDMIFRRDEDKDRLDIPWYYEDFTRVSFEGNITSIGPEAFHTSDLVEVDIPDTVERIDSLAFCSCRSLEKVKFGRHLRSIGGYAFEDCVKLRRVVLGGCVETIDYSCFEGCSSMISFETSPVLRSIGEKAFFGCSSLVRISLSDKMLRIAGNPFAGCSSLKEIDVSPFSSVYSSEDGALYNRSRSVLIAVPAGKTGVFEVPDTVVEIGRDAFRGGKMESIIVPASVRSIDVAAFKDCSELRSVTIAHEESKHGLRFRDRILKGEMFSGCSSLENVVLPEDLETIEFGAFEGCTSLSRMKIPDSVERINERAFKGSGLEEITLPSNLEYLGPMAFDSCLSLKKVGLNEGLVTIDSAAFRNCSSLEKIDIPESVVEIEEDAFSGCDNLRKAVIRSSVIDAETLFPEDVEIIVPDDQ